MEIRFDTYYDYAQLTAALQQLAAAHPGLAKLDSIGKSHEGRELWLMTITNQATGPDAEKPAAPAEAESPAAVSPACNS